MCLKHNTHNSILQSTWPTSHDGADSKSVLQLTLVRPPWRPPGSFAGGLSNPRFTTDDKRRRCFATLP